MSKKIALIFFLLFSVQAQAKQLFVPGISDLPVPINFFPIDKKTSVFNGSSGRIINATFKGRAYSHEIISFYAKTLPALGWDSTGDLTYQRDSESLEINIEVKSTAKNYDNLEITFSVTPIN